MLLEVDVTEQEFFALPPREVDALVAEKVMEWRACGDGPDFVGMVGIPPYANHIYVDRVPNFCTNIIEAFGVVEHLVNKGAHVSMGSSSPSGKWWCEMFGEGFVATIPVLDTLPMAICFAALRTTGNL